MQKNVWVTSRPNGWAVKVEGNLRATSVHGTKAEAVAAGRARAKQERSELVVQNKDHRIGQKDSEGNDPRRTRG
jgi:hypothetical protein